MDDLDKFLEAISMDAPGLMEQWVSLSSVFNLALAAAIGFLILLVYFRATGRGRHDENLRMVIPVLTILTAVIMRTAGARVVLFFGIFGIMSIVRFRSSLTDQRGITFILFSVIEGLLIGVNNYILALLAFFIVSLTIVVGLRAFKTRRYATLSFSVPESAETARERAEQRLRELGLSWRFTGYSIESKPSKDGGNRGKRRITFEIPDSGENGALRHEAELERFAVEAGWKLSLKSKALA